MRPYGSLRTDGGLESEPTFVDCTSIEGTASRTHARPRLSHRFRRGIAALSVLVVLALITTSFSGLVTADGLGDVNLALGATASASSYQSGYAASKANDGSLSTSWKCKTVTGRRRRW